MEITSLITLIVILGIGYLIINGLERNLNKLSVRIS